ncbi:MAG: molybdopterin-dependent oxidoreductase [Candidatus Marinimicrobia bacterium]|nr:molybdopterin-dependent oxidoreductase [Candidatus Neomarinimicrobiota bacterium]
MNNSSKYKIVGKITPRVDAEKLSRGDAAFSDDIDFRELLHARVLRSPHAHARIVSIDKSRATALEGVHAVLTHEDLPRIPHTTAGQGWPEPSPYDAYMLDNKVRFVGDRVAAVAAETPEIAEKACSLIDVKYEILESIFDPADSAKEGSVVIHDEEESSGIYDKSTNTASHLEASVGDVEKAFQDAYKIIEADYEVGFVQQSSIEPHVCITWIDEDGRLVIRSSTQVPFHVRRIVAKVLDIPVRKIRVMKPRVGGGFGGKQEILNEELSGALTLATGKPVRFWMTRDEELHAARTRHPQRLSFKSSVSKEGLITGMSVNVLENTGAYGTHALTVMTVTGSKIFSMYNIPNIRFTGNAVYTNLPVAGAFRGYGTPQGVFALESHIDEIAEALGIDPVEFRLKNIFHKGDSIPITSALAEGRGSEAQIIRSSGIEEAIKKGADEIGWGKPLKPGKEGYSRGLGVAINTQGSGIPNVDMAACSIKMNEDGSFNLLCGATDIGTGSDTALAQIAAETLTVPVENILVYTSDTDMTPFDTGAYASSTTYISGGAVLNAAQEVKDQILGVASEMLDADRATLICADGKVSTPEGKTVTYEQICLYSMYQHNQFQIMAIGNNVSPESPPPYSAVFADVEVDNETGEIHLRKIVAAVDCGVAVNPHMAEGQVDGAVTQGIGYALSEFMPFDDNGSALFRSFRDYNILRASDMPEMKVMLVETEEPTGPYGAKAVAEVPISGPAPAIANAVYNAVRARIRSLPITPEKVWRGIKLQTSE